MAELNDWQWAIGAAVLIASLMLGGWLNRDRMAEGPGSDTQVADDPTTASSALTTNDPSELKDAREEAELTLLQLHQVQEELEHYFLESRDLQQKLDAVKTESPNEEKTTTTITPEQQAQLKRINARLLELFKTLPASADRNDQSPSSARLEALVQRQQKALRRFQALQRAS